MNMHIEVRELETSSAPAKSGFLRRIIAFVRKLFASSPKSDQGGWEGGARGL